MEPSQSPDSNNRRWAAFISETSARTPLKEKGCCSIESIKITKSLTNGLAVELLGELRFDKIAPATIEFGRENCGAVW
jgi:hypothetical protein